MKLQLIYDNDYGKEDACGEVEDVGYASDFYIDSTLPHERLDYYTAMYRQMNKYFRSHSRTSNKVLVDVPDAVMMQYMLEGVYDFDYIAYDFNDHRICISNSEYMALRYGEERKYGRGYSNSVMGEEEGTGEMFHFSVQDESLHKQKNSKREEYMIVPDGEHYVNILEALRPYINYYYINSFKECANLIYNTQKFSTRYHHPSDPYPEIDGWCEETNIESMFRTKRIFQSDETEFRGSVDMRYDTFTFLLESWKSDKQIFTDNRQYLSDREVEAFRALHTRIMAKISETKPK